MATRRPAAPSPSCASPTHDLPDIVYIEQLTSALYLDKREDLDYYAAAMERLCVEATPPERTPEVLTRLRDELYPQ